MSKQISPLPCFICDSAYPGLHSLMDHLMKIHGLNFVHAKTLFDNTTKFLAMKRQLQEAKVELEYYKKELTTVNRKIQN